MCASKLRLPTNLKPKQSSSSTMSADEHRTRRTEIESSAKMELGRMNVAMHALDVVKQGLRVFESYNELQSVKAEWQGRIDVASIEYNKALAELETARVNNTPIMEALADARAVQRSVLALYDKLLTDLEHPAISRDDKLQLTDTMLKLTSELVALRK